MRVAVTGVTGQLGYEVIKELKKQKIEAVALSRDNLPLASGKALSVLEGLKLDAVIHCAAYTAVDKAEDEAEVCYLINERGTAEIAEACKILGIKLIYISTDYVFAGEGEDFYRVDDKREPKNVYGCSKLQGEFWVKKHLDRYFIVRISWGFGKNGKNFIKTMLGISKTRNTVRVVDDQIGSPTYMADVAVLLVQMVQTEKYGTYHATNEGICSFADLASEVFRQKGLNVTVERVSSSEYVTQAVRPKNSRLDKSCLDEAGFKRLPMRQDAVSRYLEEIGDNF